MSKYPEIDAVLAGESDGCIVCGDCREVMAEMPYKCADAVVTDPPYGIGYKPKRSLAKCAKWQHQKPFEQVAGDNSPFDPATILALGLPLIMWGANHFSDKLPPSGGWLVWDKRRAGTVSQGFIASDCELAWTNVIGTVRIFQYLWSGLCRDGEVGVHLHPTQKPISLMRWCIDFAPGNIILDPFCGSGTTCVAAKQLGRRWIGIEISEEYCKIARERVRNTTPPLFK